MPRSSAMKLHRQILGHRGLSRRTQMVKHVARPCEIFINHNGIDTKRTVATLLHDHLALLNRHPFLDSKNMKPGDNLFDKIDNAIRECKVGIAIFSPHYCESYFCLHELALLMESKKKVIPIFYDVNPAELCVADNGSYTPMEFKRFSWALQETKRTLGIPFDSFNGNWSDMINSASDIVIKSVIEVAAEERRQRQNTPITF